MTLASARPPWMDLGECRGVDPTIFFEMGESESARRANLLRAKSYCTGCQVRAECLQHAIDNDEIYGVWGGLGENERRLFVTGVATRSVSRYHVPRTTNTTAIGEHQ
jgi:WhiB family redox-sensing transcriptional regulator